MPIIFFSIYNTVSMVTYKHLVLLWLLFRPISAQFRLDTYAVTAVCLCSIVVCVRVLQTYVLPSSSPSLSYICKQLWLIALLLFSQTKEARGSWSCYGLFFESCFFCSSIIVEDILLHAPTSLFLKKGYAPNICFIENVVFRRARFEIGFGA